MLHPPTGTRKPKVRDLPPMPRQPTCIFGPGGKYPWSPAGLHSRPTPCPAAYEASATRTLGVTAAVITQPSVMAPTTGHASIRAAPSRSACAPWVWRRLERTGLRTFTADVRGAGNSTEIDGYLAR